MPLYEFHCRGCGHTYRIIAGHSEKDDARCPRCGSMGKDRVLTGGNVAAPKKNDSCGIRYG